MEIEKHSHNDVKNYVVKQDPRRKTWWRVTCKVCGGFIGYRPKEKNE